MARCPFCAVAGTFLHAPYRALLPGYDYASVLINEAFHRPANSWPSSHMSFRSLQGLCGGSRIRGIEFDTPHCQLNLLDGLFQWRPLCLTAMRR